jgi:hypothetical protein
MQVRFRTLNYVILLLVALWLTIVRGHGEVGEALEPEIQKRSKAHDEDIIHESKEAKVPRVEEKGMDCRVFSQAKRVNLARANRGFHSKGLGVNAALLPEYLTSSFQG